VSAVTITSDQFRVYPSKVCVCGETFEPSGPAQKYCARCQRLAIVARHVRHAATEADRMRLPKTAKYLLRVAAQVGPRRRERPT
jgi:hypothetical protein